MVSRPCALGHPFGLFRLRTASAVLGIDHPSDRVILQPSRLLLLHGPLLAFWLLSHLPVSQRRRLG
jgi:hypothetical protein